MKQDMISETKTKIAGIFIIMLLTGKRIVSLFAMASLFFTVSVLLVS